MLSILFLFSCQFRTWFEFNNFLCSNLQRLTRLWVAACARWSLSDLEFAYAGQGDFITIFQGV